MKSGKQVHWLCGVISLAKILQLTYPLIGTFQGDYRLSDEVSNLKIYQDPDFGFKFQYPSEKIGDNIGSTEFEIVNSIQQNGQVLRKDVDAVLISDISSACKKAGSITVDNGTCQVIRKNDFVILSLIDGATVPEELVMATAKVFIISKDRVIMVTDVIKSETAIKYADLVTKFYKENPDVKQYDYQNKKWQAYRTQITQALNGELNNAQSKEVADRYEFAKNNSYHIRFYQVNYQKNML